MASPKKGDAGPDTRTNFDKRSIRKMYAMPFEHAIRDICCQPISIAEEPVLNYSSQDVQVRNSRSFFPLYDELMHNFFVS
jgi:hypothetical protein